MTKRNSQRISNSTQLRNNKNSLIYYIKLRLLIENYSDFFMLWLCPYTISDHLPPL